MGLNDLIYVGNHGAEYIENEILYRESGALDDSAMVLSVLEHLENGAPLPRMLFEHKKSVPLCILGILLTTTVPDSD